MTLCLSDLTIYKSGEKPLFEHLNIEISPGEIVAIMGPSGCGKSTLLNLIAGHLSEDFHYRGQISLNDVAIENIEPHQRKVGILFQDDLLFPHLNIWQNLAFALPNSVSRSERKQQAIACLESVQLAELANSFPEQISGGQRARVSLLRMLLANPQAALLDEPFSKLDKALRIQFRDWVFDQLTQANIPTLLVTHDIDDVPKGAQVFSWPWDALDSRKEAKNDTQV